MCSYVNRWPAHVIYSYRRRCALYCLLAVLILIGMSNSSGITLDPNKRVQISAPVVPLWSLRGFRVKWAILSRYETM